LGRLIDLSKIGALVTNAVTYRPNRSAQGTRVIPLDSGVLVHTGLPNPGVKALVRDYAAIWKTASCPIIVHMVCTNPEEVGKMAAILEGRENMVALELGFADDAHPRDVKLMIAAVQAQTQLPILVQVPLYHPISMAQAAEEAGADAIVACAPPRGTARDPITGAMVGGRLYGPWLKPLVTRAIGQLVSKIKLPVIASGGVHNPDDARDFLSIGARAVQVDALTWSRPDMTETIARNVGGLELTRVSGALSDEWKPGQGETAAMRANLVVSATPAPPAPPPHLPK
jgi:dihydroorotate dehydrogenase (NAD+) catalytic subunit